MADLVLRLTKGEPISTEEMDANFINLNTDSLTSVKNSKPWAASTLYSSGQVVNTANRFYLVTVTGTTGITAPTHTSGTQSNGTAQLQFYIPTEYSARDVLDKLLTVDGSGSGLDADTLDGLNTSSANTPSSVVARDSSGNFSAGTITANLTGTASNAELLDGLNSSTSSVASTIVARDASGNFSANIITADLDGTASEANLLNGKTSQQILDEALGSVIAISIALG